MRVARPLRTIAAAGLAIVGLVQATGAQSIEQLYEAAKKEGTLVLYGGGPITLYEPWAREFERHFPGIKVSVKAGSSNVLDQGIDAQMKAGQLQVDMAVLQTIQDYERWKNSGVLLPFKPEGFDKIDDAWKDKDGRDGVEYPSGVGPIDILARDQGGSFFVFELKRARSPDHAIGQLARYMGWVKETIGKGCEVYGVIVAKTIGENLRYAIHAMPNVSLFEYEVEFHLKPAHQIKTS